MEAAEGSVALEGAVGKGCVRIHAFTCGELMSQGPCGIQLQFMRVQRVFFGAFV
ncbi:MAG: hypothetical protein LBJ70_00940 [Holosporales bacterium]|nr:hypothetical protein [Holosporales bacterium]